MSSATRPPRHGSHAAVLYVDDERPNRLVFEYLFGSEFKVLTVDSGEDALAALEREHVGVLVTDQRMPVMTGNELLMEVRERWPEIVRIVVTAYSDHKPILQAVNAGLVSRYIVKPWERDELADVLRWAMEVHIVGQRDRMVQARLVQTERMAMLGSVAAGSIHDLIQPTSSLSANTDFLRRVARAAPAVGELISRHGSELDGRTRRDLTQLTHELPPLAEDMDSTVRRVLDVIRELSNLLKGTENPEGETTSDVVATAQHAISICKHALPPGATAKYVGPTEMPLVDIAPSDLFRVFTNLLMNAAQALKAANDSGSIEVDAYTNGLTVEVIVRDDGPGMPESVLNRATKEFFTTRAEGTGLGLTQCQRIIEGARGLLRLESSPGVGTTITMTLPCSKVSEPPGRTG